MIVLFCFNINSCLPLRLQIDRMMDLISAINIRSMTTFSCFVTRTSEFHPWWQAQPLVTVLRAGHGAVGGQTAALSAAGNSGLLECNGEKVDKLVRVGLLQLIGGMEGLQLQSTPESFHLNFMRLRAVQGQFQEVIVMATR